MTVDELCSDIMRNNQLPMYKRTELCRDIRARASANSSGSGLASILKTLAGAYMGYSWAQNNNTNGLVGAYIGTLLAKKF